MPVEIVNFNYPHTEIGGLSANLVNLNHVHLSVFQNRPILLFLQCMF